MQLFVQNCLDPFRATEIFSVPKRQIFALPKIVRYRNKSGLQYSNAVYAQLEFGHGKIALSIRGRLLIKCMALITALWNAVGLFIHAYMCVCF